MRIVEREEANNIVPALAATKKVTSTIIAVLEHLGTRVDDESTRNDHSSMSEETARKEKFTTSHCALALLA